VSAESGLLYSVTSATILTPLGLLPAQETLVFYFGNVHTRFFQNVNSPTVHTPFFDFPLLLLIAKAASVAFHKP
jgi:hypothetical protein